MANADADDINDTLTDILGKLSTLPLIGPALTALERLHSAIRPVISSLTSFLTASAVTTAATKAASPAGNTVLVAALERNTNAVSRLASIIERIIAAVLSRMSGAQVSLAPGGGGPLALPQHRGGGTSPPGSGGAGGAEAAAGAAGGLAKIAAVGAIAAAAIGALVVAVQTAEQMFNKMREWVNLFNPGVIQMFQYAMDNLGATIGRAFVPIFTEMIGIVRLLTSILAPIIQQLVPIVKQFAEIMGGMLTTYVQNFGSLLRGLLPVIEVFTSVFKVVGELALAMQSWFVITIRALAMFLKIIMEFSPIGIMLKVLGKTLEALNVVMKIVHESMDIFQIFITSIIDAVVEFISSFIPVEDIMNKLKEAVQFVIRNMYIFAITLAKTLGLTGVIDKLIKHVEGKLLVGDTAAQTPQIKGIEQLSKDLALAAASAGGAAGGVKVRDERDFWKKTLDEMKNARDNGVSIRDLIKAILDVLIRMSPAGRLVAAEQPSGGKVGGGGLPVSAPAVGAGIAGNVTGGVGGAVVGGITGALGGR